MTDRLPVIDQVAFDKLECTRCGQCCEGFPIGRSGIPEYDEETGYTGWWRHAGPLGFIELWAYWMAKEGAYSNFGPNSDIWYGQLTPRWDEASGQWLYACGHFARDADGLGACTIYEQRPKMCADFPYGRPQEFYTDCVWAVDLVDYAVVEGVEIPTVRG